MKIYQIQIYNHRKTYNFIVTWFKLTAQIIGQIGFVSDMEMCTNDYSFAAKFEFKKSFKQYLFNFSVIISKLQKINLIRQHSYL